MHMYMCMHVRYMYVYIDVCMSTWVSYSVSPNPFQIVYMYMYIYHLSLIHQLLCDYTQQIAEQKTYEHWKSNCPELREVESREIQKHVINEWGQQVDKKQKV